MPSTLQPNCQRSNCSTRKQGVAASLTSQTSDALSKIERASLG
jgi:hypothetical protein